MGYLDKPRIANYLRVSIGSGVEMDIIIRELKEIIAGA
jgi:histidinol-phosphate/aromatic aminotransferase/cobyric acid decarboxylase-like protein